jgi:hypothetical protein
VTGAAAARRARTGLALLVLAALGCGALAGEPDAAPRPDGRAGDAGAPFPLDFVGGVRLQVTPGQELAGEIVDVYRTEADEVFLSHPLIGIRPAFFGDGDLETANLCDRVGCRITLRRGRPPCASLAFDGVRVPIPGSCGGQRTLAGEAEACLSGQRAGSGFRVRVEPVGGAWVPAGEVVIESATPLDLESEVRLLLDGETLVRRASVQRDAIRVPLDGLPPSGGTLRLDLSGVRDVFGAVPPRLDLPAPLVTTEAVTDLRFEAAPPLGAVAARGYPMGHVDGAMVLGDPFFSSCAGRGFAVLLALGEPAGDALFIDLALTQPEVPRVDARVIRGDGATSGPRVLEDGGGTVPVPRGDRPAWLLLSRRAEVGERGPLRPFLELRELRWE